jgi:hypothetical protein
LDGTHGEAISPEPVDGEEIPMQFLGFYLDPETAGNNEAGGLL